MKGFDELYFHSETHSPVNTNFIGTFLTFQCLNSLFQILAGQTKSNESDINCTHNY